MNTETPTSQQALNERPKFYQVKNPKYHGLTNMLSEIIGKAFEHDAEFLSTFGHSGSCDLLECYMAGANTRIVVKDMYGQHVTGLIPTYDFIQWASNYN